MFTFLSCLVILCVSAISTSLQCKDETGNPVDWFYVYKLPRQNDHENPLISRGVAHAYITPEKKDSGWVMSELSVGDPKSLVGKTLAPLYKDANIIEVIYNDQPPLTEHFKSFSRKSEDYEQDYGEYAARRYVRTKKRKKQNKEKMNRMRFGHTKGVILADNSTSLWLIHSVPRFPPVPDASENTKYAYPYTGMKFGQTFLCLSTRAESVDQIGLQLKYNEPLIVHISIPEAVATELPNLVDVAHDVTIESSPWHHTATLETLGGRQFLSFAKSGSYHDDLYSGLVSTQLRSDMLTETWINGPGVLQSECSYKYQVRNIEAIKHNGAQMSFSSHNDHSKWAVTVPRSDLIDLHEHLMRNDVEDEGDKWVCVGDINRAKSQERRGGGTVCTSDPTLWQSFRSLVDTVQECT